MSSILLNQFTGHQLLSQFHDYVNGLRDRTPVNPQVTWAQWLIQHQTKCGYYNPQQWLKQHHTKLSVGTLILNNLGTCTLVIGY